MFCGLFLQFYFLSNADDILSNRNHGPPFLPPMTVSTVVAVPCPFSNPRRLGGTIVIVVIWASGWSVPSFIVLIFHPPRSVY